MYVTLSFLLLPLLTQSAPQLSSGASSASPISVRADCPPIPSPPQEIKPFVLAPGKVIVLNSCEYTVYLQALDHCGITNTDQKIEPGATFIAPVGECATGGTSLKIRKEPGPPSSVMQFEFSPNLAATPKTVWYNLSFLDCMKSPAGCVGHEGGFQAVGGKGDPIFWCLPNEKCDKMAYFTPEFNYQDCAPVGTTNMDNGIGFELCAAKRH